MNQFQQELQALSLNDYRSGDIVYWDQQNQYPYYYIEDAARRCGGCGRCGGCAGRCGGFRCFGCFGCFGCFSCGGCGSCGSCSNCFNGTSDAIVIYEY
ncbi:heterocycloanthracin/sonorensin family bacteriocin [Bacillus cereus group sp. MYBK71-2]|uniref:heterocycloanthracin/sonorensin family bacteriocin n=1 Tax=Bacillus cereus group TaxID=86661 RepID=UPI0005CE5D8D|nr:MULTISPECIES: heterocycloanthracin/sonorensin family bacteriocin [Bacillus cereus group]MDA1583006.1 heterocycloanthracin/sonorensin family bacteriocin [Bacillus cereus group sp. TH230-1LC]MCC2338947.1 heterocycloanthracin/sonorensin family bacteriocin [Bacillus tropicus]MCU5424455.1 heterocycloanthracin/sonorensin family bacteriocin [Bacillus tropicus]MDA1651022.1 heterocycloanthracin/sonorensin family bacteriocin [Bacillus cereus group sp. TH160LC]MDA1800784.1 heterocycloanthracin/sonoren